MSGLRLASEPEPESEEMPGDIFEAGKCGELKH